MFEGDRYFGLVRKNVVSNPSPRMAYHTLKNKSWYANNFQRPKIILLVVYPRISQ